MWRCPEQTIRINAARSLHQRFACGSDRRPTQDEWVQTPQTDTGAGLEDGALPISCQPRSDPKMNPISMIDPRTASPDGPLPDRRGCSEWRTLRMRRITSSTLAAMLVSVAASAESPSPTQQVTAAERAFARTMAERDLQAFSGFVSQEAVFFMNGAAPVRGKAQVVQAWSGLFRAASAPFTWEPDRVEVLDSGTLALSTGPVRDLRGKVIARFNSIWRLEADGVWRVVFDKGSPAEDPPPK